MMRPVLACALSLLLFACQQQTQPDVATPQKAGKKVPRPIYIGTIFQVYPTHHFALVRLARDTPKAGVTLISHPADGSNLRLGNLCVSAEKVDNTVSRMVAADIRSGTVMAGDAVYIYMDLRPQAAKVQVEPAAPAANQEPTTPAEIPAAAVPPPAAPEANPSGSATPPWMTDGAGAGVPSPAAPAAPTTPPAAPADSGSVPPRAPSSGGADPDLPDFIKQIPDSVEGWDNI